MDIITEYRWMTINQPVTMTHLKDSENEDKERDLDQQYEKLTTHVTVVLPYLWFVEMCVGDK